MIKNEKVLFPILALVLAVGLALPMATPVAANGNNNNGDGPPEPTCVTLYAGQTIPVGTVCVWNDGDTLYVKYETTDDWVMTETHLHVAMDLGNIPQTEYKGKGKGSGGNPIPGHFDYSDPHGPVPDYTYTIDLGDWGPCTYLDIAAHAVVVRPIDDCWETVWQIGDVEGTQMDNPCDEFNYPAIVTGPQDFYVSTTPTSAYPWISRFDKNYAPTINIHFNAEMLFGGKFLFSWSPGASGTETLTAMLDATTLGTITRNGSPNPAWWGSYERYTESFDVSAIAAGDHVLTINFTSGDGSVWDWILLEKEKPCEQEETAWGYCEENGGDFPGKNWATYLTYHVQ